MKTARNGSAGCGAPAVFVIIHNMQTTVFTKKSFEKILHFLHPSGKLPLYALLFGCRMGCSMALTGCRIGEGFGGKGVFLCCFLHFLHAESLRMWNGMSGNCKIIWCLSFRAGML